MNTESRAKKESLPYNAQQRVQAVLSLWTERRRPAQVCQELAISPKVLATGKSGRWRGCSRRWRRGRASNRDPR